MLLSQLAGLAAATRKSHAKKKKQTHTSAFVFLCETRVCVVAQQHLPSYKEAVWILLREALRVFCTIFHVGSLYSRLKGKKFNESRIIFLFVFIRLFPPFGSELHLFLHFHNFNFFFPFLQSLTPPLPRGRARGLGR